MGWTPGIFSGIMEIEGIAPRVRFIPKIAAVRAFPRGRQAGEDYMDYRKYGETWYIRMDRGDEIIAGITRICRAEGIRSALYSGIGGCLQAEIQTFIPEKGAFETQTIRGMLELVSLNGNLTMDDGGEYYHHTHAMLAYKDGERHCAAGGHIKSLTVLYTAEIELRPVDGGTVGRKYDPETGTGFWDFRD